MQRHQHHAPLRSVLFYSRKHAFHVPEAERKNALLQPPSNLQRSAQLATRKKSDEGTEHKNTAERRVIGKCIRDTIACWRIDLGGEHAGDSEAGVQLSHPIARLYGSVSAVKVVVVGVALSRGGSR